MPVTINLFDYSTFFTKPWATDRYHCELAIALSKLTNSAQLFGVALQVNDFLIITQTVISLLDEFKKIYVKLKWFLDQVTPCRLIAQR